MIETNDKTPADTAHENGQRVGEKEASSKEWKTLCQALSSHDPLKLMAKLFGTRKTSVQLWGLPPNIDRSEEGDQIRKWHASFASDKKTKKSSNEILKFIATVSPSDLDHAIALKLVAATHFLSATAEHVDQLSWTTAVTSLIKLSREFEVEYERQPWLFQLVAIELPLTLALHLPTAPKTKKLGKLAKRNLAQLVADILDGDGWPAAEHISVFFPIAASWARSIAILRYLKIKLSADEELQLEWVVRQVVRLTRANGTLLGGDPDANPIRDDFLQTLLRMSPDTLDRKVAKVALKDCGQDKKDGSQTSREKLPESSSQSEWGGIGVMRSSWKANASKVAFTYRNRRSWIEIERQIGLLKGDCTPRLFLDGTPLEKDEDVDSVCEHFDNRIDYVELDFSFAKGVNLQRQIIFGKQDEFLIIADSVISPEPGALDYHCEFPLDEGISVIEETETRELYLRDKKIRSLVMPLSLPEWKIARTSDSFTHEGDRLLLQQSGKGKGLFAALFFDLKPKRSVKPRTWRQLTVGEGLRIVDKEVAIANRIQVGSDQWVIYCSIGETGNRTFFGQNVNDQVFIGKMNKKGDVKELLSIE